MPSPKQKVIIYRHGIGTVNASREKYERYEDPRREELGYQKCEKCGRRYKNPNGNHYADFKNKIRCF